ncbi:hypothetical protein [Kitasatospora aureofaciens]|uniref:hypothetical protein n=1 Tax=Kitasatospora aureofaciens TaxID=1894 RepID=UPI000AB9AB8E|nr:hypothetical protein [Kitasatospora aureofaciens]
MHLPLDGPDREPGRLAGRLAGREAGQPGGGQRGQERRRPEDGDGLAGDPHRVEDPGGGALVIAGREYCSAVSDLGELAVLPSAVTARPLPQSFGLQDLLDHVPKVQSRTRSSQLRRRGPDGPGPGRSRYQPGHAQQMTTDLLDIASRTPWGWPQWDTTDPEGEDIRCASIGQLSLVYLVNRARGRLHVIDIVWLG